MNILFCCEGFIIDGVASYNLHMAAALMRAGHNTAILGRWLGFRGFQKRHEETGVKVLQYFSPTVVSQAALKMAGEFRPDVLITDGRRGFPLALAIREKFATPIVTNFMDSVTGKDKPGRTIGEIRAHSAAWTSPEMRWVEAAERQSGGGVLVRQIRRAIIPELIPCTPMPPRDPFKLLCLGRLSGYKFTGQLTVVKNALRLQERIPTLEITVVGGGWRRAVFAKDAALINAKAGRRLVRIAGYQTDPVPWIAASTAVCGGSTCGLESILCNRPIIAVSAHWFGLITPDNLKDAVAGYYAERDGHFYIKENPEVVLDEILSLYKNWDEKRVTRDVQKLHDTMRPRFAPEIAAREWNELFAEVL